MIRSLDEHWRMYRFYRLAPRANKLARRKALGHLLVCKLLPRGTNPFPVDYKRALDSIK
jgi:hypothetical protein